MVRIGGVNGGVLAGVPKPLDAPFRNFFNHYGLQEVSKMFSTSVDLDQTRKDFEKMVNDFNGKPLKVDGDEEKHQDRDLEDEDEDKDVDESESGEEEDEADGKACKTAMLMSIQLFGDTKRASLEIRLHSSIEDGQQPKKPRVAEGSCVQGDKTEAAGI